jgi:hypothetical protein
LVINEYIERIAQVLYDGKWLDAPHFTKQYFRFKAKDVLGALVNPPPDFVEAFKKRGPVEDFGDRFYDAIETTQKWPRAE